MRVRFSSTILVVERFDNSARTEQVFGSQNRGVVNRFGTGGFESGIIIVDNNERRIEKIFYRCLSSYLLKRFRRVRNPSTQQKVQQSPTVDDILAHFDGKIAKWQRPDTVVFTDVLPRNATGKVLKKDLRQEHAEIFTS